MRVLMTPSPLSLGSGVSGIHTLARKYGQHLPDYGIEFTEGDDFDVQAVHAGMSRQFATGAPVVSHLHGLYWTRDYPAYNWQHTANKDVIESIRHAEIVTVPSEWVVETLRRDMRIDPIIVPHGIDSDEWRHDESNRGYVLWNKNRNSDVCSPVPVRELASRSPSINFVSTFYIEGQKAPENVNVIGIKEHNVMQKIIQSSAVYLSTTKETFCIGALEAMASGIPILAFDEGNITELVQHGVNGYIARCYDYDDLNRGLEYCLQYRDILGRNGQELVRKWTWENACGQISSVYNNAISSYNGSRSVTVVIPCYNKSSTLMRAVKSAFDQYLPPSEVIVVNNNSTDNFEGVAQELYRKYGNTKLKIVNEEKQGVAHARNRGINEADTRYICCLDADDEIKNGFLSSCVGELERDQTLGLAYTRLEAVNPDGRSSISAWPEEWDYDKFLKRQNQVPTCCVFRRDVALRLGGYRQRYAPEGAGAEDAEFWLRFGAIGYRGRLASNEALFRYHLGGAVGGNPNYREVDWLELHPWTKDGKHPFASLATPHNGIAHEVPQYDHPLISVVIPVGPGHSQHLINALDSLEAQTFRRWEAIVALDSDDDVEDLKVSYPYVNWLKTEKPASGAGAARNLGASKARGKYLLFLDCDDSLLFEALFRMYDEAENEPEHGIYSDYMAISYVNEDEIDRLKFHGRLVERQGDFATVIYDTPDFDCELAVQQPKMLGDNKFYIWNLISTLHPRRWWKEIGGFDESMPSWEDWDYWLRLSRKGKCFKRITTPLVVYRFHTGMRRGIANPDESGDEGRQLSGKLLEYLTNKREGDDIMACGGCSKSRRSSLPPLPAYRPQATPQGINEMSADELVLVELSDGNIGDHLISAQGVSYGYRKHGDRFMMKRSHAEMFGSRIKPISQEKPREPNTPSIQTAIGEPKPLPPPPQTIESDTLGVVGETPPIPKENEESEMPSIIPEDDLVVLWGVNEERAKKLNSAGVRTFDGLISMTSERLSVIVNCKESVAERILSEANDRVNG